ncbi:uncharacterized protein LOC126826796 [Patella vulgata]|uniref:uncharacterized protein LOC126826796 n=1 Tax=Patella vulgata TaxID=6465 RepID=UPI00218023A9|nr:uncharacterized protein LOC126826796 [Patella vulgata]
MSFTQNAKTTSVTGRGSGRGTRGAGRGSVIKRGNRTSTIVNNHPVTVGARTAPRTSLPTVSPSPSVRGRTNRGRGANTRKTMYDDDDDTGASNIDRLGGPDNRNNDSRPENRISHGSGFTVISPNEKKRREINQQAQKNMLTYEKHKEESRLQHVSYVGTAGGGFISEREARQRAAMNQSKAAFDSRLKRESVRAAAKQQEEAVYEQRKQAARKQAELNEQRERENEKRRKERMNDDMRRKNAAFLDRLEAGNSSRKTNSGAVNSSSKSRREPEPMVAVSNRNYQRDDLDRLQVMFPDCSRNYLSDIIEQMGSLELAVNVLS